MASLESYGGLEDKLRTTFKHGLYDLDLKKASFATCIITQPHLPYLHEFGLDFADFKLGSFNTFIKVVHGLALGFRFLLGLGKGYLVLQRNQEIVNLFPGCGLVIPSLQGSLVVVNLLDFSCKIFSFLSDLQEYLGMLDQLEEGQVPNGVVPDIFQCCARIFSQVSHEPLDTCNDKGHENEEQRAATPIKLAFPAKDKYLFI